MSRSRRIAPALPPENRRRLSARPAFRVALSALVCAAITLACRLGLGAAFRALLVAWNVNAETAARAPAWARTVYLWQGSLVSALSAVAVIAVMALLFRIVLPKPGWGTSARWWLIGTAMAALSAALFLLTDSLRLSWPLASPRLTPGLLLLWLLTLLTALSEELFTKGALYAFAGPKWGTLWATVAFFIINGGLSGNVISGVNVALMGIACCRIYARRGLWAAVAFRWGWSFAAVFLLGQGGGARAVWRLYGVSEVWLTGGDGGFAYGLWLTLMLVALIAALTAPKRQVLPKLN